MAWPNQIFDQLRLANLFGPPPDQQQQYDPEADFNKLYQPQMTAQNQLTGLLNNFPQEQPPSMMRKIGASLAGLGSNTPFATAFQAAHAPYLQQLQNWQTQVGATDKAADNERAANNIQRQMANQMVTQRQADIKQQEVERKNRATEAETQRKNLETEANNRRRTDAYTFGQTHPTWNPQIEKGGQLTYVNSKDPTQIFHTGIDTNKDLTDQQREMLQLEIKQKEMERQGEITRQNQANQGEITRQNQVNQGNIEEGHIASRGAQARTTQAAKPATSNLGTTTVTTQSGNTSTRVTRPNQPPRKFTADEEQQLRNAAIEVLKQNKKVVSEDTIKAIVDYWKQQVK